MAVRTHAQQVAANRAAHQSTPAQRAANVTRHTAVPAGFHQVTVPNPLSDPDYMRQHGELGFQQTMYDTQQAHAKSQQAQNVLQQEDQIGWSPTANHHKGAWDTRVTTPGTYGAAMNDITNDFASRGMAYSTPYATAVENMQNDYKLRLGGIANQQSQFNTTQADQAGMYRHNNQAGDARAKREAVARIAGKYGIQANQVTPGFSNTVNVRNA